MLQLNRQEPGGGQGVCCCGGRDKELAAQVMVIQTILISLLIMLQNTEKVFNNIQVISDKLDAQVQTIKYTVKSYDNIRAEADNVITQIESVNKSVNSLSQEKNTIIERIGNISDTFNQVVAQQKR